MLFWRTDSCRPKGASVRQHFCLQRSRTCLINSNSSEKSRPSVLPVDFLPPAPRVWAPRSSAWSPPSPGAGRKPVDPDEGCCYGCGCLSAPPSSQRWGTLVSVAVPLMAGVFHSSYQKQTHYTDSSCLTCNYNKLFINLHPSKCIITVKNMSQYQPWIGKIDRLGLRI